MEEKYLSVSLKTLKTSSGGQDYLRMKMPIDWKVTYRRLNKYCGYGYPFGFSLRFISPDESSFIQYSSPISYIDDFLNQQSDNSYDTYGRLYRHFTSLEDYIDSRVIEGMGPGYYNFRFNTQRDFKNLDAIQQKKYQDTRNVYEKQYPNRILDGRFYRGTIREYSYNTATSKRIRACCVFIDSTTYRQYLPMPNQQTRLQTTDMATLKELYPGLSYNEQLKAFTYLGDHVTQWLVSSFYLLDCPASVYPDLYRKVFIPIVTYGVAFCNTLLSDFYHSQERVNRHNEVLRNQMKEKIREAKQQEDLARKKERTFFNDINATQQPDPTDEFISDSFFARSASSKPPIKKFRDSLGNVYDIQTNGSFAYKKGDKFFTSRSDIKLELGSLWEQLSLIEEDD